MVKSLNEYYKELSLIKIDKVKEIFKNKDLKNMEDELIKDFFRESLKLNTEKLDSYNCVYLWGGIERKYETK